MVRSVIDKSIVFLVAIVALVVGAVALMVSALRVEPVAEAIKEDRILRTAIIFERNGKPAATELMMYYAPNTRAAMLDIPSETGLIIQSINRVDSIDVLYDRASPRAYLEELQRLADTTIDWYIILNERSLASLIDLLDGISVFLPNSVSDTVDDSVVALPSGFVTLDGRKALLYAGYDDPFMPEGEVVAKRQTLYQALLRRLGERADYFLGDDVYPVAQWLFATDLKPESLRRLLSEYARLDADRIVLQRLTGYTRTVEGKPLLFPHYDGELVKDIVKQSLNALISPETTATAIADKVFTIEILNGTPVRGLAQRTAEIFQSFGYEVVSVGNAESTDVAKTSVVDRYGDAASAKTVANVIRCGLVRTEAAQSASPADFVVILGKDFNGRNCVD